MIEGHSTTTPHNIQDEEVEHGNKDVPTAETENIDALPKVGSKRQRTSKAWQHFNLEEEVKDNKRLPVGICKYCNAKFDGRGTTGTSNLLRHLDKCREYKKLNSSAASGKEIDQTVFRQLVAEAVIRHGYSFCWVEHEATRKLFKYLNDRVEPISRNTVKKDCLEVHLAVKGKIMHVLKEIPGRICLTSDMWTACTSQGYLCVTAHYIDENWKLHCKLLCFRHCAPPHGGYELSVEIGNVLLEWGIGRKIFSLTVDNASNMGKAVSNLKGGVLKELLCKGKYFHVRCSAHILNLIVKKGLGVIDGSISKLREGIKYINGSEARKQRFLDLFRNYEVSYSSALWMDVETRWNSTYMMIERALKYREVLHRYFADMDGLSVKYHLTQEEWVKIEKIFDLLEPFYEITNLFSGSDYPTANLYFPQVFLIYCRLRKAMASDDIDISLTAEQMMEKFDKYWHDYVLVLAFAVIFDPRYKLKFVEFALCGTHGKDEGGRMAKEVYAELLNLYKEYATLGGVSDFPCTERVRSETEFQYDRIEVCKLICLSY